MNKIRCKFCMKEVKGFTNKKYCSRKCAYQDYGKAYEKRRRSSIIVKKMLTKNTMKHYWKNREKKLIEMKNYRNKNKEYFHNWKVKNRKKLLEDFHRQMKTDPQFRLRHRLRNRLYEALKDYTKEGKVMSSKKYGIDLAKIIEYLKPFPKNMEDYHVDHIIPLVKFDLTKPEEIKKAFAPENHQWLLGSDNLSKSDADFEEWLKSKSR